MDELFLSSSPKLNLQGRADSVYSLMCYEAEDFRHPQFGTSSVMKNFCHAQKCLESEIICFGVVFLGGILS